MDVDRREFDTVVVGGGIAGLTAAFRLQRSKRRVVVVEATDRVGGRMYTTRDSGQIYDHGTETLSRYGYHATWRLIKEVGGVATEPVRAFVGVWRHGRANAFFGHPLLMMRCRGLSMRGRLALAVLAMPALRNASLRNVRRIGASDLASVTIAQWASGAPRELYDYLLQPSAATAFGWDGEVASVAPVLSTMLSTRGIVSWRTYPSGMDELAVSVAKTLTVRRGRVLSAGLRPGEGWTVSTDSEELTSRSVVLAVPPEAARAITRDPRPEVNNFVETLSSAPMIRVTCRTRTPLRFVQSSRSPKIYALLIPQVEEDLLSGITLEHLKGKGRAPKGEGQVTLLTNVSATRRLIDKGDDEIVRETVAAAARFVPGLEQDIISTRVARFPLASPLATPKSLEQHIPFIDAAPSTLEHAGDWVYQRPSSEAAVLSGYRAAERIDAALRVLDKQRDFAHDLLASGHGASRSFG